jgi:hypothetical protein
MFDAQSEAHKIIDIAERTHRYPICVMCKDISRKRCKEHCLPVAMMALLVKENDAERLLQLKRIEHLFVDELD